jgi:hypothetical protein
MGICNRVAISVLLIASHDRPFSGEISKPDVLLQWQKAGLSSYGAGHLSARNYSSKVKFDLGIEYIDFATKLSI